MNEDIELLECLYRNSEMSLNNLKELMNDLEEKDNKIKKAIENEIKEYQSYVSKSEEIIKQNDFKLKEEGPLTKMMASRGIKKEVESDNSDSSIAHMLIQGITMAVTDIESKIKDYKEDVNKDILDLANNYLKYQEHEIEKLKEFL